MIPRQYIKYCINLPRVEKRQTWPTRVMSWFSRLFWGGPEYQTELYGVDVENRAIEEREAIVTICLQAQIEDGKRLGFRVSPKTSDPSRGGAKTNNNPLACIRCVAVLFCK